MEEEVFRSSPKSPKRNYADLFGKFPRQLPHGKSFKFIASAERLPRVVTPDSKCSSKPRWSLSPSFSNEEDTSPLLGNTPVKKNKQRKKKKFLSPMKKKNVYKSPVKESSFYKSPAKEKMFTEEKSLTKEKSVYKMMLGSSRPIAEESEKSLAANMVTEANMIAEELDMSQVKHDDSIPSFITAETNNSGDDADTITTLSTQMSELGVRDFTSVKTMDFDFEFSSSQRTDIPSSVKSFYDLPQNLLKKGLLVQSAKILTDENFIEKRTKTVGIHFGADLHVSDCELLQKKVTREQKRPKDSFTCCSSTMCGSSTMSDHALSSVPLQSNIVKDEEVAEVEEVEAKEFPNTTTWKESEEIPSMPIESNDDLTSFNTTSYSNSQLHSYSNSSAHLSRSTLISVENLDVKHVTLKAFSKYRKLITKEIKDTKNNDELNLPKLREVEKALFAFGKSLREKEWYHEAMSMLRTCLSVQIRINKVKIPGEEDHDSMSRILIEIGNIEEARLKLDKALTAFQNVIVHLNNCTTRTSKVELARTHNRIGDIRGSKNDLPKALESYQEALKIQRSELGNKHWSVAETLHNIGVVHRHNEELDLALEAYQEALDILKNVGVETLAVARTYNNIGSIYRRKGEFETAMGFFVEALKIRRTLVGDFHPSVDLTLIHYAKALRLQGDMNEAMKFYDECMK